jgi:hypothetical protein
MVLVVSPGTRPLWLAAAGHNPHAASATMTGKMKNPSSATSRPANLL